MVGFKTPPVVYGSRRHDALTLLKVLRKPASCIEMRQVFPHIGTDEQLQHALRDLVVKSFVIKTDNGKYQITNYGVEALRAVAQNTMTREYKN